MPYVEGFGDEVIEFLIVVFVFLIGALAWWTTTRNETPLIRTVVILERRSRIRLLNSLADPEPTSVDTPQSSIDTGQQYNSVNSENSNAEVPGENGQENENKTEIGSSNQFLAQIDNPAVIADDDNTIIPERVLSNDHSVMDPVNENSPIPESENNLSSPHCAESNESCNTADQPDQINGINMESASVLRQRRIAFFQGQECTSDSSTIECTSDESVAEINCAVNDEPQIVTSTESSEDQIRIRLKFLNDEIMEVDGQLNEQIGDFIRRHFRVELAANKTVRLIFNGQVLQNSISSLQDYGLFNNCVVHCLVYTRRFSNYSMSNSNTNRVPSSTRQIPPEWNLSLILCVCLSVIIVFAWYLWYKHSRLFNYTSTVGLFGLTCMFLVILISSYVPDQNQNVQ